MTYADATEALSEILLKLTKKRLRLQDQLIETEIEIKLVEKELTGGASLDKYFTEKLNEKLDNEDVKVEFKTVKE